MKLWTWNYPWEILWLNKVCLPFYIFYYFIAVFEGKMWYLRYMRCRSLLKDDNCSDLRYFQEFLPFSAQMFIFSDFCFNVLLVIEAAETCLFTITPTFNGLFCSEISSGVPLLLLATCHPKVLSRGKSRTTIRNSEVPYCTCLTLSKKFIHQATK